jgi:hypothetical protein
MAKDSSSTKVNANPDAASRNERDATAKHVMGSGSDRSFANMRKAQSENVTFHKSSPETRKSRRT